MWVAECAGGLTQFQLMEDSGPATQTQKAVADAITKNTLSMIGYALQTPPPLPPLPPCWLRPKARINYELLFDNAHQHGLLFSMLGMACFQASNPRMTSGPLQTHPT